jgi:non-specific serine/threonine protein kinase
MVVADRVEDGSTRYRMLESHHDFAREKLVESGELDQMRGRHYEYFRAERWTSRDVANFWAAIAWAKENVEDGGLDLAIEVADAGHTDQARARVLLLELLGRAGVQGSARARALNLAARLTTRQADYVESRALADRSIAAARELKDPELLAQMLSGAGVVYHAANELDRAHLMYDEALTLLQTSPNRRLAIEVQNEAAVLLTEQGRHQEAVAMLEECLAFTRAEGDRATTAKYLESQANALLGLGDVDAAARNWRDALATFSELNDPFGTIWCMGGLALVASRRGEHENALRLAAVADRMSRQWSLSAWPLRIAQLEEAMKAARRQLGQKKAEVAWNEGAALPDARALEFGLGEGDVETAPAEYGPLSRREREVVAMVAAGMTNKEIASRLFIAERTAEGHVERIRNKLGVRSRTEVATWAVGHGITAAELDNRKPGSTV